VSSRSPNLKAINGDTELSTNVVDCQPLLRNWCCVPTAPEQECVEMLIDAAALAVVSIAAIGGWLAASTVFAATTGTSFAENSKKMSRLLSALVMAMPLLMLQGMGPLPALEYVPAVEYVAGFIWLFFGSVVSVRFVWELNDAAPILIGMIASIFAFMTLALTLIGFHLLGRL
jgi:hypothetical protein